MTSRLVAVVSSRDGSPLALAMLEDVVDLVEQMQAVQAALVVDPGASDDVRAVSWAHMPVIEEPSRQVLDLLESIGAVETVVADEITLVAADVPDLPALLLGKLHSALTSATVAVCPAEGGGLVAMAVRLPVPAWLRRVAMSLDDSDALPRLQAAAPSRQLSVGPGWHRIRTPGDVDRLDPGLEGWDATRALLGRD